MAIFRTLPSIRYGIAAARSSTWVGNRLERRLVDALDPEVDERKVVCGRERAGEPGSGDDPLFHERLCERSGAGARSRLGEPVGRNQAGRLEKIRYELGDRIRRDARATQRLTGELWRRLVGVGLGVYPPKRMKIVELHLYGLSTVRARIPEWRG